MQQARLVQHNCRLSSPNVSVTLPQAQARRTSVMVNSAINDHLTRPTDFYDREVELSLLRQKLTQMPASLMLLMGPVNCGKTALLKSGLSDLRDSGVPVSYIDTRVCDMKSPEGMAMAFADNLWPDVLNIIKSGAGFIQGIGYKANVGAFDLAKATSQVSSMFIAPRRPPLNVIMEAYSDVLRRSAKGGPWPILVLDEANTLSSWAPVHSSERAALLQFFLRMSKQENKAHVVLVTSDWSFADWLKAEFKSTAAFEIRVIGNFTRDDAKGFFEQELRNQQKLRDAHLAEGVWDRVFQALGGNPGKLRLCAVNYNGNWDEALHVMTVIEELNVRDALSPSPVDGWSTEQFVLIMRALCASQYGAVDRVELERQLGKDGKAVIASLLKANMLGIRPGYSCWARDVPAEAWDGGSQSRTLITAASATLQYVFDKLVKELEPKAKEVGWWRWLLGK